VTAKQARSRSRFQMKRRLVAAGQLLALSAGGVHAETLRLEVGKPLARFDFLRPGTHRYLRYTVAPDERRSVIDIWTRALSFENHEGHRRLHIVQRWDEVADKAVLIQDSWFDPKTFKPQTHIRHLERDGKTTLGGYRFTDARVVGMTDLVDNGRKDFVMPLSEPSFNFEYDMEFLQTLPLAAGRTFNIPFYDAGVDKPGRYDFVVARSAVIAAADGRPANCWLVTADYNTGKVVSRFWFAKTNQVLLREEQAQDDGSTLVKTLLLPEAGDAAADRR
jgi:hypothetical protein